MEDDAELRIFIPEMAGKPAFFGGSESAIAAAGYSGFPNQFDGIHTAGPPFNASDIE